VLHVTIAAQSGNIRRGLADCSNFLDEPRMYIEARMCKNVDSIRYKITEESQQGRDGRVVMAVDSKSIRFSCVGSNPALVGITFYIFWVVLSVVSVNDRWRRLLKFTFMLNSNQDRLPQAQRQGAHGVLCLPGWQVTASTYHRCHKRFTRAIHANTLYLALMCCTFVN
jgi:hypothetical protein